MFWSEGPPAVEPAWGKAPDAGPPPPDVFLSIRPRRRAVTPPLTIATPDALKLRHHPLADCARYDRLRRAL